MIKKILFLLVLCVSMISCLPEDDFKTDAEKVQEYIQDNNITDAIKGYNGVYIRHIEEGQGLTITEGQGDRALITYKIKELETGALLKESDVAEFLTISEVIPGMQVGLAYMKIGGTSMFYIPASMAWGNGNIMIEVTLVNYYDDLTTTDGIIQNYFAENGITEAIFDETSGVYIKHIQEGEGPTVTEGSAKSVMLSFTIKELETGGIIDESEVNENLDIENLIPGLKVGLGYMKIGGTAIFYIPSEKAWDNNNLIVEVTLVNYSDLALTSDQIIQNYFNVKSITDTIADPSGLYIKHIAIGDGALASGNIDKITVKYTGAYILSGNIFDQRSTNITFTLDNLIEGWKIAIPYMKKGGKANFYIPADLAYEQEDLMFQVELVDFTLKQ